MWAGVATAGIWVLAMVGYTWAKNARVTADKVQNYVSSVDFSKLSGEARAKVLRELARQLNALSLEERRKVRFERTAMGWFHEMTEEEKSWFIDETMPTGFKQMLASFEELPETNRRRTIDQALRRLKEAQAEFQSENGRPADTNALPVSKELETKIRTIGLKTFYSQSSAQTKAELAPVLEELQRVMQSGRAFHHR
jgi:hypothetical protein